MSKATASQKQHTQRPRPRYAGSMSVYPAGSEETRRSLTMRCRGIEFQRGGKLSQRRRGASSVTWRRLNGEGVVQLGERRRDLYLPGGWTGVWPSCGYYTESSSSHCSWLWWHCQSQTLFILSLSQSRPEVQRVSPDVKIVQTNVWFVIFGYRSLGDVRSWSLQYLTSTTKTRRKYCSCWVYLCGECVHIWCSTEYWQHGGNNVEMNSLTALRLVQKNIHL